MFLIQRIQDANWIPCSVYERPDRRGVDVLRRYGGTHRHCHLKFNFTFYFGMTLHVSDGLSVHHQEFKTVHTATGVCQTDTAVCLLAGTRWNCKFHLAVSV